LKTVSFASSGKSIIVITPGGGDMGFVTTSVVSPFRASAVIRTPTSVGLPSASTMVNALTVPSPKFSDGPKVVVGSASSSLLQARGRVNAAAAANASPAVRREVRDRIGRVTFEKGRGGTGVQNVAPRWLGGRIASTAAADDPKQVMPADPRLSRTHHTAAL
jgi:hypothetical protein